MDLRLVLSKSMHETHIHSYYNKAYKAAAYVVSKKRMLPMIFLKGTCYVRNFLIYDISDFYKI